MDTVKSKSYLWFVPQNHKNPLDLFKGSKRTMFKRERLRERETFAHASGYFVSRCLPYFTAGPFL